MIRNVSELSNESLEEISVSGSDRLHKQRDSDCGFIRMVERYNGFVVAG